MTWFKRKKQPACPVCGSRKQVPILYGLPTDDAFRRAERGELFLGGCFVSEQSPMWICSDCNKQWGAQQEP